MRRRAAGRNRMSDRPLIALPSGSSPLGARVPTKGATLEVVTSPSAMRWTAASSELKLRRASLITRTQEPRPSAAGCRGSGKASFAPMWEVGLFSTPSPLAPGLITPRPRFDGDVHKSTCGQKRGMDPCSRVYVGGDAHRAKSLSSHFASSAQTTEYARAGRGCSDLLCTLSKFQFHKIPINLIFLVLEID